MHGAGAHIDEHGILGRRNTEERARDNVRAKDVDLERPPPVRGFRLGQGDELRHEACVVDEDVDMLAHGLESRVDGVLVRAVGDEGEYFGFWEGSTEGFLGGLKCFLGAS